MYFRHLQPRIMHFPLQSVLCPILMCPQVHLALLSFSKCFLDPCQPYVQSNMCVRLGKSHDVFEQLVHYLPHDSAVEDVEFLLPVIHAGKDQHVELLRPAVSRHLRGV
jgi:hypothetical protein